MITVGDLVIYFAGDLIIQYILYILNVKLHRIITGAEKLLEILFDGEQLGARSLRIIPFNELVAMLDIAHCHILHYSCTDSMNSYVLRFAHFRCIYY